MVFIHTSDLHIGKKIYEEDILKHQKEALSEIIRIAGAEKADGIIIAGDIFDTSVPSGEAVRVFDDFVTDLKKEGLPVYIISGNHDSEDRLSQFSRLLTETGTHISPRWQDSGVMKAVAEDEWGKINIWLIPYLRPITVRTKLGLAETPSWTDAMKAVVDGLDIDRNERNIAVVHQFIENSETSESEVSIAGGLDAISSSVFDGFDYVALGHLHKAQRAGGDHIRYSGTPLKYSFGEKDDEKSVTVLNFGPKGSLDIKTVPVKTGYDLVEYEGTLDSLIAKAKSGEIRTDCYTKIVLTDDTERMNAQSLLREQFPNLLKLSWEKNDADYAAALEATGKMDEATPLETVGSFWSAVSPERDMTEDERKLLEGMIGEIWGN